ncbi:sensor histidine kinase [Georgenia ruanii]|uniref:sensor histidine kinase n=1 Tax=Georgenia ruanii TaxID=348442 RepID=UPI001D01C11B|nr:histidine kinase [Georgenia ruanii]
MTPSSSGPQAPARGADAVRPAPPRDADAVRPAATARPAPPALGWWQRTWRYLAAAGTGFALWVAISVDFIDSVEAGNGSELVAGGLLFLDAVLGLLGLGLLPLRRRFPTAVAVSTAALTALSASAVGPAALATVSLSTWRRRGRVVAVVVVWAGATALYELVVRRNVPGLGTSVLMTIGSAAFGVLACGICVATGYYVGARRELLAFWRERAETAEREHALAGERARAAERTRIAREMHDVLAHRISLVALHAGALTYRTDLDREETAAAAAVIQDNAHLALGELRQILGVLRAGETGSAEPPQPTLADLPALLADAAEAGTRVVADTAGLPGADRGALAGLPQTVSRTAFRIIQEALTNARKHAPGAEVRLGLAGHPGGRLALELSNGAAPSAGPAGPPGAGMGLAGLTERADLAGGALEHGLTADGRFVVRAWLPWPS